MLPWFGMDAPSLKATFLENLQIQSARVVSGALKGTNRKDIRDISWVELGIRRRIQKLCLLFKIMNKTAPFYLLDLFPGYVSDHFIKLDSIVFTHPWVELSIQVFHL